MVSFPGLPCPLRGISICAPAGGTRLQAGTRSSDATATTHPRAISACDAENGRGNRGEGSGSKVGRGWHTERPPCYNSNREEREAGRAIVTCCPRPLKCHADVAAARAPNAAHSLCLHTCSCSKR